MSIFKFKPWWSNDKLQDEKTNEGFQNGNCLKVDRFSMHSDSDCIILGDENLLKIYKPSLGEDASHLLLEREMNNVVLYVETGKFTIGSADRQILVLHPQCYAIYALERREGHTDAGDQNLLTQLIKHTFTRKAHSLICGPFGNIKTRDLICIQGLDGSLSFFDQDTFLFICVFEDVIVPGPIGYIAGSDAFVLSQSTWVLEIYSYQQLRDFSELNRQNKKNIPQWVYNAGEEISSVQVIQTSNNFSSIVALGERYLYCFQDNGLMKFIKKFDFMPLCFYAYLIGWYYEPGARMLVMVASEDSKLYIYEGTTVLWSCDLLYAPISICRSFLKALSGGVVTLSTRGIVSISYLGTEPHLNPGATPVMNETTDPEQVQADLGDVEEALQRIFNNKEDVGRGDKAIDDIVKIKAEAGKPVQNLFEHFTQDADEGLHLLMCPIVVILTCAEPKMIQAVQITYVCSAPFACSDSTICLDGINGTEIIETHLFLASDADISDTNLKISFTVTDAKGKIVVISRQVWIPVGIYCVPGNFETAQEVKFEIHTNKPCVDLLDLFADFSKEDLTNHGSSSDLVSLLHRGRNKNITIRAANQNYVIETDDISEIIPIIECVTHKLMEYYTRMVIKNFQLNIKVGREMKSQITHTFLKSIEAHAKERIKMKTFEDTLNVLQRQFTIIQKRLLVQYGSSPPGNCDSLEFLMRDTYKRLSDNVHEILECRKNVSRAGCKMAASGQLIIFIFRMKSLDPLKVKLFEGMLSFSSLYDSYQDWEEGVTQALTYVLKNVFKKSGKDKEKLAPVTEQGVLSQINLKRFLKQLKIVIDAIFAEAEESRGKTLNDDVEKEKQTFDRIEEFVEVI